MSVAVFPIDREDPNMRPKNKIICGISTLALFQKDFKNIRHF